MTDKPHWDRPLIWVIISASALLMIGFSLGPISESPDEFSHYTYVRHLIRTRSLPDPVERPFIQAHQAPLYYVLGIPFLLAFDGADVVPPPKNPWGGYLIEAVGNDNKNVRLHSRQEIFPYANSPVARAIHITRLLSILIGVGTVITSYAIFGLLWPANPALRLTALGFVAFWPQFLWLSSVLNNDNLLNLMSTLALLAVLYYQAKTLSWKGAVGVGTLFGLALLSKASAVFLALPFAAAAIFGRREWRQWLLSSVLALAIGAWWYARNLTTIGTLSGWPDGPDYGGLKPGESLILVAWERMPFVYRGFWARFGQVDVPVSALIYSFFDALLLICLAGLVWWVWRALRQRTARQLATGVISRRTILIALFAIAWLAGVFYSAGVVSQGNQGRYLLPGIAAWGAALACGLHTWIPERFRLRSALATPALMASIALICLFGYFYPAYRPLPLPGNFDPSLNYRFGDVAELIGIFPQQLRARPGETIAVSLYWRALRPSDQSLVVYLHSVNSDVMRRDSFPGTGNLLSADWQPGQTWEERYVVTIPRRAETQTAYSLIAGLYDFETKTPLPVTNPAGDQVTPIVGRIAINGPSQPYEPDYRFGGLIGMAQPVVERRQVDGHDDLKVCLKWVALAEVPTDYHFFVHVFTDSETPLSNISGPPSAHPQQPYPTGAWLPGEVISQPCLMLDAARMKLPETGWYVAVGLFDPATGDRLIAIDRNGQRLSDDRVVISP